MSDVVGEFVEALPAERRDAVRALAELVVEVAPELKPWVWQGRMWGGTDQSILGFGRYSQNASGKAVEWFVIGLASQKAYLSMYVSAAKDGRYLAQSYGTTLGKVKLGSSSVSFRQLSDLDLDRVRAMVAEAAALPEWGASQAPGEAK